MKNDRERELGCDKQINKSTCTCRYMDLKLQIGNDYFVHWGDEIEAKLN